MQTSVAPQFATHAHDSRSNRYGFVPTSEIVSAFENEGWLVHSAQQARTRMVDRRGFNKHALRFRRVDAHEGDTAELIFINAHDGSSSSILRAGFFRFFCLNGLVVGDDIFPVLRVHHGKDALHRVIEGSYRVLKDFPEVEGRVEAMKQVQLEPEERLAFARAALPLRFPELEGAKYGNQYLIEPAEVLRPRRYQDEKHDLWTTFNVVQENLVKGGRRGYDANGKRRKARAVNGIDQNTSLNSALWTLAEEMRRLKGA